MRWWDDDDDEHDYTLHNINKRRRRNAKRWWDDDDDDDDEDNDDDDDDYDDAEMMSRGYEIATTTVIAIRVASLAVSDTTLTCCFISNGSYGIDIVIGKHSDS